MGIMNTADLYIAVAQSESDKEGDLPGNRKNGRNIAAIEKIISKHSSNISLLFINSSTPNKLRINAIVFDKATKHRTPMPTIFPCDLTLLKALTFFSKLYSESNE